jgi:hypothetical protein
MDFTEVDNDREDDIAGVAGEGASEGSAEGADASEGRPPLAEPLAGAPSQAGLQKGGVRLPYFHRTLPPEESQLIGDITPKRIVECSAAEVVITSDSPGLVQGSAWNAAKIWEEKDYTPWAKQTIQSLFSDSPSFKFNETEVTVSEIEDLKGHANVTYSRGKPRYMYSVSFTLAIDIDVTEGDSYTGKVTVEDVMNDVLDDIELSCNWTSRPSNTLLKECNTAAAGKPMKDFIISKIRLFEEEYQKKQ